MESKVISMLADSLSSVIDWFNEIFTALPLLLSVFLGSFVVYSVVRLLLVPLIGQRGSDRVTRTETTEYKAIKTKDGQTWYYASSPRYTVTRSKSSRK